MLKTVIIPIVIVLIALYFCFFTVDETEQVVLTQFGRAIGDPIKEPGLKFKYPWRSPKRFPKNLLEWDGEPDQIPTLDKKLIYVDTFARWKIVDPLTFFQTMTSEDRAQALLDDTLNAAVRSFIGKYPLIETVRKTNRELEPSESEVDRIPGPSTQAVVTLGREKITGGIFEQARPKLQLNGIELVDIKIKRLNYEESVRRAVYDRMIAERQKISEKRRSEGQGEARKIEGVRDKEFKKITSEAYRTAQEIKGKADAESTEIYARAFSKDPDFYSFIQTVDIYKEAMGKDSSLILSTDSEFLKYFKGYEGKETE